jgi:hypothetical protein
MWCLQSAAMLGKVPLHTLCVMLLLFLEPAVLSSC